jgi:hypothetical protein
LDFGPITIVGVFGWRVDDIAVMRSIPGDLFTLADGHHNLEDWLESFHWPAQLSESTEISLQLEAGFQSIVDSESDDELVDVLIVAFPIVRELASILFNLSILEKASAQGVTLESDSKSHNLRALSIGASPPFSGPFSRNISSDGYGLSAGNVARRLMRRFRTKKTESKFNAHLRELSARNGGDSSGRSPANSLPHVSILKSDYTAQRVSKLRLISTEEWLPWTGLAFGSGSFTDTSDNLVSMFRSVAANLSISVPDSVVVRLHEVLGNHLRNSAALYRTYLEKSKQISGERLLVAALGNSNNRALAVAARRQGAVVTGFLHGNTVFAQYEHNRINSEMALCDEYVVYADSSIPRIHEIIDKYPPFKGNVPRLISINDSRFKNEWERNQQSRRGSKIKRVMILEYGILGDRAARFKPPDLVNVDLIIRVAKLLRKNGYEVVLKRHPDPLQIGWAPDPYSPFMDISYDRFEDVMDDTDAYVITYPTSSVFHSAVCSNKPIVYLDDGLFEWFDEPRELFRQRARVVDVSPDERNRLMFSEDELLEAFSRPVSDPDARYVEQLLFPQ